METVIIIGLFALVLSFLIWASVNRKDKKESKLGIFEHPSTFKKPDIEMVNPTHEKNDTDDTTIPFETLNRNKKA